MNVKKIRVSNFGKLPDTSQRDVSFSIDLIWKESGNVEPVSMEYIIFVRYLYPFKKHNDMLLGIFICRNAGSIVYIFQSRNTFALLARCEVWDDGYIKGSKVTHFEH